MCGVAGSRWPGASDRCAQSQRHRLGIRRGHRLLLFRVDAGSGQRARTIRPSVYEEVARPSTRSRRAIRRRSLRYRFSPGRSGVKPSSPTRAARRKTRTSRRSAGPSSRPRHPRPRAESVARGPRPGRSGRRDQRNDGPPGVRRSAIQSAALSVADGTASKRARRSGRHRQRHQVPRAWRQQHRRPFTFPGRSFPPWP